MLYPGVSAAIYVMQIVTAAEIMCRVIEFADVMDTCVCWLRCGRLRADTTKTPQDMTKIGTTAYFLRRRPAVYFGRWNHKFLEFITGPVLIMRNRGDTATSHFH